MRFALDTNTISYAVRGSGGVRVGLARIRAGDVGIPSMCVFEVLRGAYKRNVGAARHRLLNEFLQSYPTIEFDAVAADHAARIDAELAAAGVPIGRMDGLIAGTARARALTLVTRNLTEFARVPGLTTVDWY